MQKDLKWYKRSLTSKQLWLVVLACVVISPFVPFVAFGVFVFPFAAIFTWRKEQKAKKTYKA